MGTSVNRVTSLFLFMLIVGLTVGSGTASATRGMPGQVISARFADSCSGSAALSPGGTSELQMGPGGDFAGATVIRLEPSASKTSTVVQMGPGGDFAGATVIRPGVASASEGDGIQLGPGGDFAGATVIHSGDVKAQGDEVILMGPGGDFAGAVVTSAEDSTPTDSIVAGVARLEC